MLMLRYEQVAREMNKWEAEDEVVPAPLEQHARNIVNQMQHLRKQHHVVWQRYKGWCQLEG